MKAHITVLEKEAVDALALSSDSRVVDATVGGGGHTARILNILDRQGIYIGIDADVLALDALRDNIQSATAHTHLVCGNYRKLRELLATQGITEVDAVLADLGWRMDQFISGGRGFSFTADEPLHMTYGDPKDYPFTAEDIVNEWAEGDIANVLKGYGEERYAKKIAHGIIAAREQKRISTAAELAAVIKAAVPHRYTTGKVHPATRTFQALRIAVNDELEALEEFLRQAITLLAPGGRLAIITFHSLEDRIVKHAFRAFKEEGVGTIVTKKPIYPTDDEVHANPRARSAKLRIFEKYGTT